MYGSCASRQELSAGMPDWKQELLRKKRTMHKAFPSWAALVAPGSAGSGDRPRRKAVHLADAPRVPAGLVCQLPCGGPRASMGEDKRAAGLADGSCSDHSSAQGDLSSDGEPDDEWQYGPGFVDRLKCKFLSLSLCESSGRIGPPGQRPLRAYASVENLLEPSRGSSVVVGRPQQPQQLAPRAGPRGSFPRARSMETLLDPLINEDVVIVERSPRPAAAAGISDGELPRVDIVRTCKRIFEASDDNRRPPRRRPPVLRARAPLRGDKENSQPSSARATAFGRPRTPKPVANIKPLRKEDDLPNDAPPLKTLMANGPLTEDHVGDRAGEDERAGDERIDDRVYENVDDRIGDRVGDANKGVEPKAAELLRPSALLRNASPLWPSHGKTAVGGGGGSVSPAGGTTSMVFDFRGKNVKPHLAVSPAPGADFDELDSSSDEPLPFPSGIVFIGENVRIGRGALLTTRNKKLKIQFDDSALVTIEYPSEEASPSPRSVGPASVVDGLPKGVG
ncbi:unnamed protein product, partial [Ixodes hexagonus]